MYCILYVLTNTAIFNIVPQGPHRCYNLSVLLAVKSLTEILYLIR